MTLEDDKAQLEIVTTLSKAIELYPLIHTSGKKWNERNRFFSGMHIQFHKPSHNLATITCSFTVPDRTWFSLFNDDEKEILEDDYVFYGIKYKTVIGTAKRRIEKLLRELEEKLSSEVFRSPSGRFSLFRRDELKDITEALNQFNPEDEVSMFFVFPEWPDVEKARKKDYVKEFEGKLLNWGKELPPEDLPF